jgi:hypothetical protein
MAEPSALPAGWEIAKSIANIIAVVGIPSVVLVVGNLFSKSIKEREIQSRFVELAVNILREVSPEMKSLRAWALQVIDKYSGVPLGEAKEEIIGKKLTVPRLGGSAETSYEPNMEMEYKGYIIEAKPNQRRDNGSWTTSINILAVAGAGITARPYYAENTYDTREEAISRCFEFGKRIIDGEIKGLSPPTRH